MIIWNKLGFVVGIIAIACLVLAQMAVGDAWSTSVIGKSGAFIAAALLTFAFDKFFLASRADSATRKDSLFFVPVKFWPIIFVALAIIVPVAGL